MKIKLKEFFSGGAIGIIGITSFFLALLDLVVQGGSSMYDLSIFGWIWAIICMIAAATAASIFFINPLIIQPIIKAYKWIAGKLS